MRINIYMDRDNTLIEDCPYCSSREQVRLMEGAAEAVKLMREAGMRIVVITNQSGIGRGYFTVEQMHEVNERMIELLRQEGADIDGIYYCPHRPDEGCACRKPATGMIERARIDFPCDREFLIGDMDSVDGELARNIGIDYFIVSRGELIDVARKVVKECRKEN